jgi:hypothetical protein
VEGETPVTHIKVERTVLREDPEGPSARQKWDEIQFFKQLDSGNTPQSVRQLGSQLRELARRYPESVVLAWGSGKEGSMVVKRSGGGLIEVYGFGRVRFRPENFSRALGDDSGNEYRRRLEQVVPDAMKMSYPHLGTADAAKVAPVLFKLVEEALARVESKT